MKLKIIRLLLLPTAAVLLVACGRSDGPISNPTPDPTYIPVPIEEKIVAEPTSTPSPVSTDTPLPSTFTPTPGLTPVQGIRLERVFPKLDFQRLTNLAQPDDGQSHIFVTEQPGLIHVVPVDPETTNTDVFLDIRDRVSESGNEEGLLGLAFDTKYSTNGHFYVYYSASSA